MIKLNDSFLDSMKQILKNDYNSFVTALNKPSEKAVFVNTNKISCENFLSICDFGCEKIPYEPSGFYVENEKLGRHPLHHAGAFYVQEPSAMFTVNALKFLGNEKVLDMCAAPGGKSIQIANRIPNGVLVSNEISQSRSEILFSNIERMGLKNVIVSNDSPENIAKAYANCFDVCLVDAPCSGEGMFRKGEDYIKSWNPNLPKMCAIRQLAILEEANKTLKTGGYLIYSTCTYSVEENENVVIEFLKSHNYKLLSVDAPKNFARGINLEQAVRLYPHMVRGEGQFVAVMQKREVNNEVASKSLKLQPHLDAKTLLKQVLNSNVIEYNSVLKYENFAYLVPDEDLIKQGVKYVSLGVKLGQTDKGRFVPHHNFFSAFGAEFKNTLDLKIGDTNVMKYLKGEALHIEDWQMPQDEYGAILIEGCALGGFKISNNGFKNYYPKGLRNFKVY